MAIQSKQSGQGWFPWKISILLLVLGTGIVVNHDVENKGSFDRSNIGLFLKDVGFYHHTVKAYDFTLKTYGYSRQWAEVNVPIYYNQTVKVVGPYLQKTITQAKVVAENLKVYGQKAINETNKHLPGLVEKLTLASDKAKVKVVQLWHYVELNGPLVGEKIVNGAIAVKESVQLTVTQIIR